MTSPLHLVGGAGCGLDPFLVVFHPPGGWTGFLMEGSQGGLQERASGSCKESSGLGLETVYCHPCPFHWSKQIRVSVEGLSNGVNTGRYNPLVPSCNCLRYRVKEKHMLE